VIGRFRLCSNSLAFSLSLSLSLSLARSLSLSLALSLALFFSLSRSLSLFPSLSLSHTHSLTDGLLPCDYVFSSPAASYITGQCISVGKKKNPKAPLDPRGCTHTRTRTHSNSNTDTNTHVCMHACISTVEKGMRALRIQTCVNTTRQACAQSRTSHQK
jgi:hypothetical protein